MSTLEELDEEDTEAAVYAIAKAWIESGGVWVTKTGHVWVGVVFSL